MKLTRRRASGLLSLLAAASAVAACSTTTAVGRGAEVSATTYVGSFPQVPGARVKLRVFGSPGEPTRVRFRFRRLKLRCDDGRVQTRSLGWSSERFEGRHFDDVEYYDPGSFGIETYIRVQGRLHRDGRATGSVFYFTDPHSAASNRECTTATGIARWRARPRR
jgi:hypothetical protein